MLLSSCLSFQARSLSLGRCRIIYHIPTRNASSTTKINRTKMPASFSASDYKPSMDRTRDPKESPAVPPKGCCSASADDNGASFSHRGLYIGLRSTGILLALTLIALSVLATRVAGLHGRWLSAMLGPSINSTVLHAVDLWGIYRTSRRSPPVLRLFWDGGVAVGIMIAAGFVASWTAGLANNNAGDEMTVQGVDRLVLGAVIVAGMYSASLIHLGMSITGFRGWRKLRAARSTSAV
ncbi:hypothetical protein MAPG_04124 [Magnaporthiopsis poae ATCC 64411]|uniref:Uncharacterized protein n=1 Tax=Magnaporthiopsis poae (strain ATCC 64411 / 73-15) TaxID=644358 RepID=A0A0C4DVW1_MAGP6|nr:hypothetical protein MAPG_04124 [Magnaporthiopsis poae ATCC 64411]